VPAMSDSSPVTVDGVALELFFKMAAARSI
jgi:hypothetical protein